VKSSKVSSTKLKTQSNLISKDKLVETVRRSNNPRLLFAMDATASREHAWTVAKEITEAMFNAIPGELSIALAYHGGGVIRDISEFTTDRNKFARTIRSVNCLAGLTAVNPILEKAIEIHQLRVLIYVGDFYEENIDLARESASALAVKGVRCFFFHDKALPDSDFTSKSALDRAEIDFRALAKITKGAVFPFDANSPEVVASILGAIAYYSARGLEALKQLDTPGARKLLAAIAD
jgi:hypothetical protein